MVKFDFESFYFEYDKESFKLLSDEVVMICPHCGGKVEEYQKTWMMDWDNGAKWIPNNPGHVNRGYKLSSLYSPLGWRSWKDIILEWLKAQSKMKIGDTRLMKRWKNTRLAEVWEEDYSKIDIDFLKEKQEDYEIEVPFGVVNIKNEIITSIEEKPIHKFFVNAGIYILQPECLDYIPKNQFYDMPNLFEKLIKENKKTISFS